MIQVDKELWKAAKVLAAKQERPVKMLVAVGLRLLLKEDQAFVAEALQEDGWPGQSSAGGKIGCDFA